MEMTEYGKHGKPRSRLSMLPTLIGNPFGITTFLRPRLLAYFEVEQQETPELKAFSLKGVLMEVLGPKCSERSNTLTVVNLARHLRRPLSGRVIRVIHHHIKGIAHQVCALE